MPRRPARLAFRVAALLAACAPDPAGPDGGPPDPDRAEASPGDTLFAAVAVGEDHACALTRGGRAWCWGTERSGQLGTRAALEPCDTRWPDERCTLRPVPVDSGLRFTALAAGSATTCGLTPSGRVWCWGAVPAGDRGPSRMAHPGPFRRIHVGASPLVRSDLQGLGCGVVDDGRLYCWRHGDFVPPAWAGPLPATWDPESLAVLPAQRFVAAGPGCGVTTANALYCWGGWVDTTAFETAGEPRKLCYTGPHQPAYECAWPPVRLRGAPAWAGFARGLRTCAITVDGSLSCFGSDGAGRDWAASVFEGGRSPAEAGAPVRVALDAPVRDVVALTGSAACAHVADGRVLCWGRSYAGEFGNGVFVEEVTRPTPAAGGRAFVSFDARGDHACGVTAAGEVYCWGRGDGGVLGTGGEAPPCPTPLRRRCSATPLRVASIAARGG